MTIAEAIIEAANDRLQLPSLNAVADLSFFDKAPCGDVRNVSDFFPDSLKRGTKLAAIARAKAVCDECPVKPQCRTWALTHLPDHGVWAGMTALELKDVA